MRSATPVDVPARAVGEVAEDPRPNRRTAAFRLVRLYLEMVVAMALGMAVLGPLESLLASSLGRPDVLGGTTVAALMMAANMTVGMAAWMRARGHRTRLIAEMSAATNVAFVGPLVPMWAGAIGASTHQAAGQVLAVLGMLVAMLARHQEYLHGRR